MPDLFQVHWEERSDAASPFAMRTFQGLTASLSLFAMTTTSIFAAHLLYLFV
jgi:hypothetical protein